MDAHDIIANLLAKYLPNTLILPAFGNNDWLFHYQSPYAPYKDEFYKNISNNWFLKQPIAAARPDLPQWNETFMKGGYYRVDLTSKISVLSLNTLMFNSNLLY